MQDFSRKPQGELQDDVGADRPATSIRVGTLVVAYDAPEARPDARALAVEMPVNVVYGTVPYAVMMLTPADLEDFAYGFSLTEGVIESPDEIRSVAVEPGEGGLRLLVDLAPGRLREHLARKRAISGRTGCGVCGIEDLAALPTARTRSGKGPQVTLGAIQAALTALSDRQTLNRETRAVHAAGWAGLDGTLAAVREDVGRHNALDKCIGALLREGVRPDEGFLVITSRCSFEMVDKTLGARAPMLVGISAPTDLAVGHAAAHGLTLLALARRDAVLVMNDPYNNFLD